MRSRTNQGVHQFLARAALVVIVLAWRGSARAYPEDSRACAEALFQRLEAGQEAPKGRTSPPARTVQVVPAVIAGSKLLPVKVFEARSVEEGRPTMVRFVLGDTCDCVLIGGDLDRFSDLPCDLESRIAWGLEQYNACLDSGQVAGVPEGADPADYVLAVLSAVGGAQGAALVRPFEWGGIEAVGTGERLPRLPEAAVDQITAPLVSRGKRIDRAVLFTWEEPGTLVRNEGYVWSSGRVALLRETIAVLADADRVPLDLAQKPASPSPRAAVKTGSD